MPEGEGYKSPASRMPTKEEMDEMKRKEAKERASARRGRAADILFGKNDENAPASRRLIDRFLRK